MDRCLWARLTPFGCGRVDSPAVCAVPSLGLYCMDICLWARLTPSVCGRVDSPAVCAVLLLSLSLSHLFYSAKSAIDNSTPLDVFKKKVFCVASSSNLCKVWNWRLIMLLSLIYSIRPSSTINNPKKYPPWCLAVLLRRQYVQSPRFFSHTCSVWGLRVIIIII